MLLNHTIISVFILFFIVLINVIINLFKGLVYFRKNEYDKALEYYSKSLAIWKDILGENHTDVATSYNNIGISTISKFS